VGKKQKSPGSLVSRLRKIVSSPLIFELGLAAVSILAFALYQEVPPGLWALIRRILGRW
jgi:hypothetical protein